MTDDATQPEPQALSFGQTVVRYVAGMTAAALFVKGLLAIERHGAAALLPGTDLASWLYRDAIIALLGGLLLGVVAWLLRERQRTAHLLAGAGLAMCTLYMALNIAFFRTFSTPLNRGLMAMAGGTGDLGESFATQVTFGNAWPVFAAAIVTTLIAWSAGRAPRIAGGVLAILLGFSLLVGSVTVPEHDARGLERNALWELVLLPLPPPEVTVQAVGDDERIGQPIPRGSIVEPGAPGADLEHLRGAAADMNVIYVVLESTSAEYLGLYGAEEDTMPNLSRIAQNAMVFDSWYSVTPASMKSLFATMCSTWPYPRPIADTYIHPQLPCHSLSEMLTLGGYRASLVHSGKFSYTKKHLFLEGRGFESLWDKRSLPHDDDAYSDSWGIEEEAALAQIQRFLDDAGQDRFFLMYMPIFPHYPYNLPPNEPARYGSDGSREKYLSALAYSDRILGELYADVARRGLLDSTLFVIVGDHGEAFAQHPGNRIHSTSIYEENVHVPALWSNPVLFPEMVRIDAPADHTSMAPSLMDLMGRAIPERWQGRSLFEPERQMARFFTDYAFLYLGLRDGQYKVIHKVQTNTTELFDLSVDPNERDNIADEHPELTQKYREHLDHWYVRQLAIFADYDAYLAGTLADTGITFLQNLAPDEVEHGDEKTRFGVSARRRPLIINDVTYTRGVGMYANSRLTYNIAGQYTELTGLVGRNESGDRGVVVGEVWVDGVRVFESGELRRHSEAVAFTVDLTDAQTLEFVVSDGGDGTDGDAADWVSTQLR